MKITIIKGDLTQTKADAIVNEVNPSLAGCGGIDNAICKKAGLGILDELRKIRKKYPNGLTKGEVIKTKSYDLSKNIKVIIHTAVPSFPSDDLSLLRNCYLNSLKLAEKNKCKTIAFPALSTGIYDLPIETSAKVVKEVLDNYKSGKIQEVFLVLYYQGHYAAYKRVFGQ